MTKHEAEKEIRRFTEIADDLTLLDKIDTAMGYFRNGDRDAELVVRNGGSIDFTVYSRNDKDSMRAALEAVRDVLNERLKKEGVYFYRADIPIENGNAVS